MDNDNAIRSKRTCHEHRAVFDQDLLTSAKNAQISERQHWPDEHADGAINNFGNLCGQIRQSFRLDALRSARHHHKPTRVVPREAHFPSS